MLFYGRGDRGGAKSKSSNISVLVNIRTFLLCLQPVKMARYLKSKAQK